MTFTTHGRLITNVAQERPLPSLPRRVRNFGRNLMREGIAWVRGVPPRTEEEALANHAVCRGCSKWYRASDDTCAHPKCGCPMGRKTKWRTGDCPEGLFANQVNRKSQK